MLLELSWVTCVSQPLHHGHLHLKGKIVEVSIKTWEENLRNSIVIQLSRWPTCCKQCMANMGNIHLRRMYSQTLMNQQSCTMYTSWYASDMLYTHTLVKSVLVQKLQEQFIRLAIEWAWSSFGLLSLQDQASWPVLSALLGFVLAWIIRYRPEGGDS